AGRDHYLGRFGTQESHDRYDRLIARFLAGDRGPTPNDLTLTEAIAAYWDHVAAQHYDRRQADRIKRALGVARDLYGDQPAESFRGRALKAIQAHMVNLGWRRRTVNQRINCLKTAARWMLSEELLSAAACGSLCALPALRQGRTEAPESPKVTPPPPGAV